MKYNPVDLRIDGHVAVLTLSRPDLQNRFDKDLHLGLLAALGELRATDARAAVLESTGKVFSAGGDFDWMLQANEDHRMLREHIDVGRKLIQSFLDVPIPVVAAVQGPAVGLGASIVLACDAVVMAKTTFISDPHVQIGLVAGDGGCLLWPAATGGLFARRYLLTGDRVSAERAYELGLATDLVDGPDDVGPEAMALATRMAALPPVAVQGTKRALANMMRARATEVFDLAFSYEMYSATTDDLVEAVNAVREKREPSYVGR